MIGKLRKILIIGLLGSIIIGCSACTIDLSSLEKAKDGAVKLYEDTEEFREGFGKVCETIADDLFTDDKRSYESEEDQLFNGMADAFFEALDTSNEDAIYELFAPKVRNDDPNLKDKIHQLTQVYHGPTDTSGRSGTSYGSYSSNYGDLTKEAGNTFPVIANGEYYWCSMDYCYQNDLDEEKIGIESLSIFSADYYCACRYEDISWPETTSLGVYVDYDLPCEVRAVDGSAHKFTPYDRVMDMDEVVQCVSENRSFRGFTARYGQPNVSKIYYYYELPMENGRPQFLCISVDENLDSIRHISVVDDLGWVANLWDRDESLIEDGANRGGN